MRSIPSLAALAVVVFASVTSRAQLSKVLDVAEKATALVKISEGKEVKAYGSSFCIDASGIFVTNAHVTGDQTEMDLVLEPGETAQRVVHAKVLRADKDLDLAVLQAQSPAVYPALTLATTEALVDTSEIVALGYPFGGALTLESGGYPSISVNTGHVTSLRKKAGELNLIQVDAALNPGNSGGPVLDNVGRVVGIVQAGIPGSGVSFAIPVRRLQKLLAVPVLSITPTTLAYDKRFEIQPITVSALSLTRPSPAYTVELTLSSVAGAARVLTGTCVNGACRFNAPLLQSSAAAPITLSATFADGQFASRIADRELRVGAQLIKLSDIAKIELASGVLTVTSKSGAAMTGAAHDLDTLSVTLGGTAFRPGWATVQSISLASASDPVESIDYTVSVKLNGQSVGELKGTFDLDGANAIAVASGAGSRSATDAGATTPASGGSLFAMVRKAVAGNQFTETKDPGGGFSKREPYRDLPAAGVLIGFNYSFTEGFGHHILAGMQPIFLTADGERLGKMHGQVVEAVQTVKAKPGYVVSSMTIRAGGNFDGFSLTYSRLQGKTLRPDDNYNSDWVGHTEGGGLATVDSGGGVVVGVYGKEAEKIGSVGFLAMALNSVPAPSNAEPRHRSSQEADPAIASGPVRSPVHAPAGSYASFEQILEALPSRLKPHGGNVWNVAGVTPSLNERLRGQIACLSGEFSRSETRDGKFELHCDGGTIHFHGFDIPAELVGQLPPTEAARYQNTPLNQQFTFTGKIQMINLYVAGRFTRCIVWVDADRVQ